MSQGPVDAATIEQTKQQIRGLDEKVEWTAKTDQVEIVDLDDSLFKASKDSSE